MRVGRVSFSAVECALALVIFVLGGTCQSNAAPVEQPKCEGANIDVALAKSNALYVALWDDPKHGPAFYRAQAASLYDVIPACETLEKRAGLSETEITKYFAVALVGYCDIALSTTAAQSYQLGRDSMSACLNNLNKMHAVATARNWKTFFVYERRFRPIIEQTDQLLTDKGFPAK